MTIFVVGFEGGDDKTAPPAQEVASRQGEAVSEGWTTGMPTLEAVRKHAAEYPMKDDRGHTHGGVWLVIDDECPFGAVPALLRLRVMKKSEASPLEAISMGEAEEAIMLQNGHTFWQPLKDCRWAQRARYRPCTAEGVTL